MELKEREGKAMSEDERRILQLVIQGGDARCAALEAIEAAREGKFGQAAVLLERSSQTLAHAHSTQTDMLQEELNQEQGSVTLLMVHAQDHLMSAITVRDLAREIVELYRREERA